MVDGFLPTPRQASFMFDLVVVAMVVITPVLAWSIYKVRRHSYSLHKNVQVVLGSVLLVAVVLFEVDIRLDSTWWDRAMQSPYYANGVLRPFLIYVHLPFAVSTTVLWAVTLFGALRRFPKPPSPSNYSRRHRWLGWLAAVSMFGTAVTGWLFYWMAFVATS